jgi:hypothetical protein
MTRFGARRRKNSNVCLRCRCTIKAEGIYPLGVALMPQVLRGRHGSLHLAVVPVYLVLHPQVATHLQSLQDPHIIHRKPITKSLSLRISLRSRQQLRHQKRRPLLIHPLTSPLPLRNSRPPLILLLVFGRYIHLSRPLQANLPLKREISLKLPIVRMTTGGEDN